MKIGIYFSYKQVKDSICFYIESFLFSQKKSSFDIAIKNVILYTKNENGEDRFNLLIKLIYISLLIS